MTSSFRDPYALGATNYLATAPDLTDAMIKEQDASIKDTQEFYRQMAELEKQRFEPVSYTHLTLPTTSAV